ncbi:MAG: rRNA (guanine527-N7)-methyltransferase [Fimbriimonadaceae bacterium]|jgi:16S rRNA (guanine527-N7)-methyltransferase|nr:rRNA (guanine527-N7)-methyltransferase [Fimbriimonadaceae bacterium]
MTSRQPFAQAAAAIGLPLTDTQLDAFEAFEENLYAANEVMNLTRVPREEAWLRHYLDSLLFHDLIPEGSTVLDIGSGAGFPAWPLACARPDLKVTSLDSSGKMLGFLQRNPLPNLESVLGRAENWRVRDRFDVVTGRALAPLPIQLELSSPPARVGGLVIPMRTPAEEADIRAFPGEELGLKLDRIETRPLPDTDVIRAFPVYRKLVKTDRRYPRTWAEIKRDPLG